MLLRAERVPQFQNCVVVLHVFPGCTGALRNVIRQRDCMWNANARTCLISRTWPRSAYTIVRERREGTVRMLGGLDLTITTVDAAVHIRHRFEVPMSHSCHSSRCTARARPLDHRLCVDRVARRLSGCSQDVRLQGARSLRSGRLSSDILAPPSGKLRHVK